MLEARLGDWRAIFSFGGTASPRLAYARPGAVYATILIFDSVVFSRECNLAITFISLYAHLILSGQRRQFMGRQCQCDACREGSRVSLTPMALLGRRGFSISPVCWLMAGLRGRLAVGRISGEAEMHEARAAIRRRHNTQVLDEITLLSRRN